MIETRNQRRARRNRHAVKAKANGRLRARPILPPASCTGQFFQPLIEFK